MTILRYSSVNKNVRQWCAQKLAFQNHVTRYFSKVDKATQLDRGETDSGTNLRRYILNPFPAIEMVPYFDRYNDLLVSFYKELFTLSVPVFESRELTVLYWVLDVDSLIVHNVVIKLRHFIIKYLSTVWIWTAYVHFILI